MERQGIHQVFYSCKCPERVRSRQLLPKQQPLVYTEPRRNLGEPLNGSSLPPPAPVLCKLTFLKPQRTFETMGYDDNPDLDAEYEEQDRHGAAKAMASTALTVVVHGLGLVLILVGLWAIVTVIVNAVGLYNHPERITPMVSSIEKIAGMGSISSVPATGTDTATMSEDGAPSDPTDLRPAYFLAWLIVFMLFLVIGKLADWVITRGMGLVSFRCPPSDTGH